MRGPGDRILDALRLRQNRKPRVVANRAQPPELHRPAQLGHRSRGRCLNDPDCQPTNASYRPRHMTTCRSLRPANRRSPR